MNIDWVSSVRQVIKETQQALGEAGPAIPSAAVSAASLPLPPVQRVVFALEQFQECVRYLNTRRSKGAIINIDGEDDVQDTLYLMLRPWIDDLVPENPTNRVASRFAIKDFLSKELYLVIEAKYVRDERHGREISKELHDDIEIYRTHPDCETLVFFIYDPDSLIPDVKALKRQIEQARTYGKKTLSVFAVVKP